MSCRLASLPTFIGIPPAIVKPRVIASKVRNSQMGREKSQLVAKNGPASFRLCSVSGYKTELVEIHAKNPTLHVLFIPGNPGVVSFYTDFLECLYESLGGTASVTAVGHISHTEKDWERRRLFSLKEQIDHKIHFIEQELDKTAAPIILVGHSIGSYICIEVFRRFPKMVVHCIGLYPFLAVDTESRQQAVIKTIAGSQVICVTVSSAVALLGLLPAWASRFLVRSSLGNSWSFTAVEALRRCVLQYHTMRNVLYMAMTEFKELVEVPDWAFMREKRSKISFLFGLDDHWGPLKMLEEISKQVPDASLEIEREGHTHGFCCTEAGSFWAARHVASLIKCQIPT